MTWLLGFTHIGLPSHNIVYKFYINVVEYLLSVRLQRDQDPPVELEAARLGLDRPAGLPVPRRRVLCRRQLRRSRRVGSGHVDKNTSK